MIWSLVIYCLDFFFSSRRRHTRSYGDWSSDVCSSDLRRWFRAFRGQNDLSRLAEATGAESYYLGLNETVTFKPYLDELATHLRHQYLLTFKGSGGPKGRFQRVHVATETPGVQFLHAPQAFLPAEK